jgi:DNA polymerase-3 subunit gamma/tau
MKPSDDLALSMRPQTFEELVGLDRLVKKIRGQMDSGHSSRCWLLHGQTGTGKTTIARIMAISLQCTHQKRFGHPCRKCRRRSSAFDIVEINASDITGIDALREATSGAFNFPKPGSKKRVYILDEAHQLSKHAQNLLLKFFEESPKTTWWFICTTKPVSILDTLQSRCTMYEISTLDISGVKKLVKRALEKCKSDKSVSELADCLLEKGITGGRSVLRAVQKYIEPETTAEEASKVALETEADVYAICRGVIKGDWESVGKRLMSTAPESNVIIRRRVSQYLQAILVAETDFSERTNVISKSILLLNSVGDDMPATVAVLWKLCKYFRREER